MFFIINFLTALALSLDAFSLSIIYGTIIREKNKRLILAISVGLFHFFMPLLGYLLGNIFVLNLIKNTNIISFIIFIFLGLEMFFNKDEEQIISLTKATNILLFAFTVSIDSFSVGIVLSNKNILIPIMLFSTVSFLFTFVGLVIGNKLDKLLGKYTTKLGGLILILLSFYYLFT
ncbi:MAG: manganese efflux pump [Bacilli bacterium]|nr:manganese efflux pump [Bacilli bacterium]